MISPFKADPAFDPGSIVVADWPLCQVRLQDDARFPWLILIPRRDGLHELEDLAAPERVALMEEIVRAGETVRMLGEAARRPVQKLNVAALGNVTAQLFYLKARARWSDQPVRAEDSDEEATGITPVVKDGRKPVA